MPLQLGSMHAVWRGLVATPGFPSGRKQRPCAASCSTRQALLCRHMFLHPDGRWRGRILHRSVALGSGEGEGPADQQDEAVPRTYLSEHPTEQAGDSWQNLHFSPCRHSWHYECWGTSQQPRMEKRPGLPADGSSPRLPCSLPSDQVFSMIWQHNWFYTSSIPPFLLYIILLSSVNFRVNFVKFALNYDVCLHIEDSEQYSLYSRQQAAEDHQ